MFVCIKYFKTKPLNERHLSVSEQVSFSDNKRKEWVIENDLTFVKLK